MKGNYEVDHKTPLARQGKDQSDNLQGLCRRCNKEKGARTHREYLHYRKYRKDLATYQEFRRLPKYLTPRELLHRAQFPLVIVLSITGLVVGNETIERPLLGAGAFCVLTIAWIMETGDKNWRTGRLSTR